MPTPRKYESSAERQRAYRHRRGVQVEAQLNSRGIPPLPAIPSMPGHRRWKAMVNQARFLLENVVDEMRAYQQARSDEWQDSEQADEFAVALESAENAANALADIAY